MPGRSGQATPGWRGRGEDRDVEPPDQLGALSAVPGGVGSERVPIQLVVVGGDAAESGTVLAWLGVLDPVRAVTSPSGRRRRWFRTSAGRPVVSHGWNVVVGSSGEVCVGWTAASM